MMGQLLCSACIYDATESWDNVNNTYGRYDALHKLQLISHWCFHALIRTTTKRTHKTHICTSASAHVERVRIILLKLTAMGIEFGECMMHSDKLVVPYCHVQRRTSTMNVMNMKARERDWPMIVFDTHSLSLVGFVFRNNWSGLSRHHCLDVLL